MFQPNKWEIPHLCEHLRADRYLLPSSQQIHNWDDKSSLIITVNNQNLTEVVSAVATVTNVIKTHAGKTDYFS